MRRPEAGFTLIEMLVVLAIIGVMAGVTVIGLGAASRGTGLESEAQQMAARIRLAQDEAMVTGQAVALSWNSDGYGVVTWDETAGLWRREPAVNARHALPGGMRLEGPGASVVALQDTPLDLRLSSGGSAWRITSNGLNVLAQPAS